MEKILLDGRWCESDSESMFQAFDPSTGKQLTAQYPVSSWQDCEVALAAAEKASQQLRQVDREQTAGFLESYAQAIEDNREAIVAMAHRETGLAIAPRLNDVELPRTTNQLRQAAQAAREASWARPTIDSKNNIRSVLQSIGPVLIFGPNNFPLAFGSISGGDFAAAIAAGNPVIAKAHPLHPETTKLLAELANQSIVKAGLPAASVQLLYATSNENGLKLVSDARIGATGFTGSKAAGLALKQAADVAGKPIYLEMSSLNPVILLPTALNQKSEQIAAEFVTSCTMAAGQLCTKPGLLLVGSGESGDQFVEQLAKAFDKAPVATLLSPNAEKKITVTSQRLQAAGAQLLTSGNTSECERFCHSNTLLSISGDTLLQEPSLFLEEMFGNASLIVQFNSLPMLEQIIQVLPGSLTGCIYSSDSGEDDADYDRIEPCLRDKVGRILNDKMPTGVAVSSAMNHGGPYPATGHPGFTAVGLPASIQRFSALKCFDGVRQHRLPDLLADQAPASAKAAQTNQDETYSVPSIWRLIDDTWTLSDVSTQNNNSELVNE